MKEKYDCRGPYFGRFPVSSDGLEKLKRNCEIEIHRYFRVIDTNSPDFFPVRDTIIEAEEDIPVLLYCYQWYREILDNHWLTITKRFWTMDWTSWELPAPPFILNATDLKNRFGEYELLNYLNVPTTLIACYTEFPTNGVEEDEIFRGYIPKGTRYFAHRTASEEFGRVLLYTETVVVTTPVSQKGYGYSVGISVPFGRGYYELTVRLPWSFNEKRSVAIQVDSNESKEERIETDLFHFY
ncbi:MAG: hypothetical protein LUD72_02655 [Bacteroidales bacterium]|nr:hypothetical protein [Bacteroidales bacterium]